MDPRHMIIFRCFVTMLVSTFLLMRKKKAFIPKNLKPYLIRNLLQCLVLNGIFMGVKLNLISVFNTIFNTRCLMCFLIETYINKKRPRLAFVVLSIISFIGILMLIYPSLSNDLSGSSNSTNDTESKLEYSQQMGVFGPLFAVAVTFVTAYSDIYTNLKGKAITSQTNGQWYIHVLLWGPARYVFSAFCGNYCWLICSIFLFFCEYYICNFFVVYIRIWNSR